jgi:hypothetical protein
MIKKQWHLIAIILFAAIISCVYFVPFIHNFFVYDSFRYIGNLFAGPKTVMLGYNAFRLVSNFIWYPLYALFGIDSTGYSIFNGVLYALNAVLLYVLLVRLWGKKEFSLLVAALFVLNVTASDAVFWHMSLSTLLCAALYLLTLTAYVVFRKEGVSTYWLVAFVLYVVTMFTKEDAASLPLVLVLLEVFYFDGLRDVKTMLRRVIPFFLVIVSYLVISNTVFYLLGVEPETAKFFKIRPLYSLFGGYTAFFLNPEGSLNLSLANPYIYLTVIGVIASFFIVSDRKLLLFGYFWIMVTFLPQSFSAIGQFHPKIIFNSISRLLYLPVIGVSMVIALLLLQLKHLFPQKVAWGVIGIALALFFCLNYSRVQARGAEWRDEAEPGRVFLVALEKMVPRLPRNTHFYAFNGPTGRAYMQQSLRALYGDPTITWIVDPSSYVPQPGFTAILMQINWANARCDAINSIEIVPFNNENLLLMLRINPT